MIRNPIRSPLSSAIRSAFEPSRGGINIAALFGAYPGREGVYYGAASDPRFTALLAENNARYASGGAASCIAFADPSGTVPLLSVSQADRGLGLLLDRSKGLIRGTELIANGEFSGGSTGWTADPGWSIGVGAATATAATGLIRNNGTGGVQLVIGKWYEASITVGSHVSGDLYYPYDGSGLVVAPAVAGTHTYKFLCDRVSHTYVYASGWTGSVTGVSVKELPGNHYVQPTATARGEITARVNDLVGTDVLSTQNITTIAAQRRLSFSGAGTVTLSGAATGVYSAGSHLITCTAGTLTHTVSGSVLNADSRLEADAIPSIPSYQRVTTPTDYDSAGFPVRWRGQTDDFGKTHINPNGATKALVMWAGQKLSDAAVGIVVESSSDSSATNGTLALFAPNTAGQPRYMLRSRGTATSEAQDSTHPAPGRDVIRAQTGIATDVADLYVDGALAAQSATDQGTGAYTEQDVFFWSRAGTSLFFNGYASTLPLLMFMQSGDPGLSAGEKKQLDKAYAKAGGVTL